MSDAIDQFFDVDDGQQWQLEKLRQMVTEIGDQAVVGDKPATVELSLADIRRLLADRLQGAPSRSQFFRGGITVSSLTPLRWLPFRVICLLGLDEAGTSGTSGTDGDDLAAAAPLVGDREPRSEVRQALLEAVLAARDHLVITRTGHNVRTNRDVPNATVLAELRDTITATLAPKDRDAYWHRIETVQPCQAFDERCFTPGALNCRIPGVSMRARSPGLSPASTGRATTPRSSPVPCPWLRLSGLDSAGHRSALVSSRGFSTIP